MSSYEPTFCFVFISVSLFEIVKVHLVCDIGAAELKVNWLFWFLSVDLANSYNATLL